MQARDVIIAKLYEKPKDLVRLVMWQSWDRFMYTKVGGWQD